MEYAPILDPAAYTSKTEPTRRLALAAASVLQAMASDRKSLVDAMTILSDPLPDSAVAQQIDNLGIVRHLLDGHPMRPELLRHLLEQLRQVKSFCEMDGGTVDDYVEPVSRLIQSGRVELFAGRSARAA